MKRVNKADQPIDLTNLDVFEQMLYGNVEDDPDLEAELLALQNEISKGVEEEEPNTGPSSSRQKDRPSLNILDEIGQLTQQMSDEALVQDDEEDDANIENDEDLLHELSSVLGHEISDKESSGKMDGTRGRSESAADPVVAIAAFPGPTTHISKDAEMVDPALIIPMRLENYRKALELARLAGEDAKERRYARAITTLNGQLKAIKNGKVINFDDVPPDVALPKVMNQAHTGPPSSSEKTEVQSEKKHNPSSSQAETSQEAVLATTDNRDQKVVESMQSIESSIELLSRRRDEYKVASLRAKQSGDTESALRYFKICKQLDQLIDICKSGQTVDTSDLPPSISLKSSAPITVTHLGNKATSTIQSTATTSESLIEALSNRMEVYRSAAQKAREENDGSKFRRMSRVQKEYEEAVKAVKSGRKFDFSELPSPPGFPPLPGMMNNAISQPFSPSEVVVGPTEVGEQDPNSKVEQEGPSPPKQTKQQKQLAFLLERQRQFKVAACHAKKRGDLTVAKNLLRQALGFDQMIEASKGGLPVNISSTPLLPQPKTNPATLKPLVKTSLKAASDLALDKACGSKTEATALVRENRESTYSNLERDLIKQVQLCEQNRDYFTNFGDINKVKLYETLGSNCRKELDALRIGFKYGDPVPRFHYETKKFPVLQCCPDLGSDDLQISVIRGLLLKLPAGYEPKDADIFVKFDLAYPKDNPQCGKTCNVRGTNSPSKSPASPEINLKSRQFLLYVKRHGVKFEIYQKGSFLRSDKILGVCELKFSQLENKAEIHESLDIMEGRRPAGGKLEVKARIREALLNKSAEEVQEKWLIIDEFLRLPKGRSVKSVLQAL